MDTRTVHVPGPRPVAEDDWPAISALSDEQNPWCWGCGRAAARDLREACALRAGAAGVLKDSAGVAGIACLAPASDEVVRALGVARDGAAARDLIAWTLGRADAGRTDAEKVRTSASARSPMLAVLGRAGFKPYSSQRTMRWRGEHCPAPSLPPPYRFAALRNDRLAALRDTYALAWPDDDEAAAGHFESAEHVVLVEGAARGSRVDVAGYALWEVFDDGTGVIHEVAVHPRHRRRGIGTALTAFAVRHLRDRARRIELLVMDENSARRLYERLGFAVAEHVVNVVSQPPHSS